MSLPLVSVIIPTYNYARYIAGAIDSILNQIYPTGKIEIVVVDDGSTDNTKEVLQPYIRKGQIHYYYQENKGKANATRQAIQKTSGDYIFNLDADDYYLPDKIAASVRIFESNPDIVHVGTPAKVITQTTNLVEIEDVPADIMEKPLDGNWLMLRFYTSNILFGGGSTYSVRASVIKSIIIPDAVDMYIDEFLILAVLPFGKSYFISQPLSVWRVHGTNYSTRTNVKELQIKKEERLIHSSEAVLKYLELHHFNKKMLEIYRLRDATRRIVFKEYLDTKTVGDIVRYVLRLLFYVRPGWNMIMQYNVPVRLFPSSVIRYLKARRSQQLTSVQPNHSITLEPNFDMKNNNLLKKKDFSSSLN